MIALGIALIALPFVGLFIYITVKDGIQAALITYGSCIALSLPILAGGYLLELAGVIK